MFTHVNADNSTMVRTVLILTLLFFSGYTYATPVTSGLDLWVDASDLSSLYQNTNCTGAVTTDGQTVGCLQDKSGNGNNYTATLTPLYDSDGLDGLPAISYSGGAGHNTSYIASGEYTIFTVSKLKGTRNGRVFSANNANILIGYWAGREDSIYINGSPSCHAGCGATSAGTSMHLYSLVRRSDNSYEFRDGPRLINSNTASSATGIRMSIANGGSYAGEYSDAFVSEVLIYNRALSTAEIESVNNYLVGKWYTPTGATAGPAGVTGASVWVDASDKSSLFSDSACTTNISGRGDTVACMKDKSGNNNNYISTGTPIYQPTDMNGHPTISYTGGAGHHSSLTFNNDYTVFTVSKMKGTRNRRIFSSQVSNYLLGYWNGREDLFYNQGSPSYLSGPTTTTNQHFYSVKREASGAYEVRDGTDLIHSGASSGNPNVRLSIANGGQYSGEYSDADVSEVIIYERALTTAEINAVTQYLKNKWEIPGPGPGGVGAGLRLWLDSQDQSRLYTDANCSLGSEVSGVGDTVRCWQDKGPDGFQATNTGANVPTLVQDGDFEVLEFTSDQLNIPGNTGGAVFQSNETVDETEVFFVARTRTVSSGSAFWHNNGNRRFNTHFPWGNNRVYFDVGVCCGEGRINAPWGGSSSFLHTWNFVSQDNTTVYQAIYRDGVLVNEDTTADRFDQWGTGAFYIGGIGNGTYQQINAGELIIYDRRLTDAERELVKNYLLNKWKKPVEAGDEWVEGFTRNVTSPAGTDRMLLVAVGGEHVLGRSISGVTYGGQALTEIIQEETGTSYGATASFWYLDDAGISAASGNTFNVTYNGGGFAHTDIASAVYSNINQDNPVFVTESVEDGQSFASSLSGAIDTTAGGLTILTAQSGEPGTFGSSMTVEILESGNSTSQVVSAEVEPNAINKNFTVTHNNSPRMVVVAAHLRQNVLPEVASLSALADSDTSISLSWDPEPGVTNYRISYLPGSTAPSLCTQGTLVDAGYVSNYQVTGLNPGTEYSFRVCASDNSKFTNGLVVSETTDNNAPLPPNELLSVTANALQPDTADFTWVSGGGGTTGFKLAYSAGASAPADCNSGTQVDLGLTTSFQLTGLSQLNQYSYRVCAYNGTPVFTPGLIGSFTTPAIASSSNVVSVLKGWAIGAQRSDLGSGQNRGLLVSISREGGTEITGATFGGQAMTLLAERTQGNLSIETYIIGEAGLTAATGDLVEASFSGGAPFYVSYSTIVLENVHQGLLATSTGVNSSGNANTTSTNLTVNNGGLSLLAGANSNQNRIGSMGTAGWVLGSSTRVGSYMTVTGYHPNNAAGTDIARANFSGNGAVVLNGVYLELAIPTEASDLALVSNSDTVANLTWTSGYGTTDSFILAYQVGSAPINCNSGTQLNVGNVEVHSLSGLTADTTYGVRLCSVNVQGIISSGQTLTFQTDDTATPLPNEIVNLSANVVSDSEVALSWNNGGGSTDGFTVAYQLGGTAPADCVSGSTSDAGLNVAYPVSGLAPSTLYSFRVCSRNANGEFSTGLTVSALTEANAVNDATVAGTWQTGLTRVADAGSNRALVFVVSSEDNLNADVTGVTYGGESLTFAEQASFSTAGTFIRVEIWYLLESGIQSASGNSFTVDWSGGNLERRYYSHVMLEDIDQVNPLYSKAQSGFPGNVNPIERSISSIDGGFSVVGAVTQNNGTYSFNNSWTFGSNQSGNSSSLGTGHFVSSSNGTEIASATHTSPTGVASMAVVHFQASEALPPEITNLALLSTSSSVIDLGWQSGGGSTNGFQLAYQLGATAPVDCNSGTVINTGVNTTRSISGLTQNTQYSFRVCSYNSSGDYSNGLTITAQTDVVPTQWTGTFSSDWFFAPNWSAGVPTEFTDCIIPNVTNDPIIDGSIQVLASCKSIDLQAPLTLNGAVNSVELELYGNLSVTGAGGVSSTNGTLSLAENTATAQTVSSTAVLPNLNLKKSSGGSVNISSDLTVIDLNFSGTNQSLNTGINDISIQNTTNVTAGSTINLSPGSRWLMGSGSTLFLSGGAINTDGAIDTSLQTNPGYGPSQVNFGVIGGTGSWGFEASSGSLNLKGVRIDRLSSTGLRITGSTSVPSYTGTQFTNLPVGAGNVAMYLNTTGKFPANGSYNAFDYDGAPIAGQFTVLAPGACGSGAHAYTFLEWFGNFATVVGNSSVSDNAPTCDIVMETSTSPVTMALVKLTPFNNSVKIYWETAAEFLHKGFNVYRSVGDSSEKVLVSSEPVVSLGLGMSIRGEYNFTDSNLVNGTEYSYYLEDLPIIGEGSTYGPYKAVPIDVPESLARSIEYKGPSIEPVEENEPDIEDEVQEGDQWLSKGITYRFKPDGSLRLFIKPPVLQTAESSWNNSYSSTFMQDYYRIDQAGKPALPFITLNIPVDDSFQSLNSEVVREESTLQEQILPEPAPVWIFNEDANRLEPSWSIDTSVYNSDALYPEASYYNINNSSIVVDGQPHLQVKVYPVQFTGSSQSLSILQDLVLDIDMEFTNRAPSSSVVLPGAQSLGPDAGVRIVVKNSGFHKVTYQDLFNQGLESQFENATINEFRLVYKGKVIPVLYDDQNDEGFGDGDTLIFKADVEKTAYSSEAHFILTRVSDGGVFYRGDQGVSDADWGGEIIFDRTEVYEVDDPNQFINDRSLGTDRDHFYWKRLFLQSNDYTKPALSKFCHPVSVKASVNSLVRITVSGAMRSNVAIGSQVSADIYWESEPEIKRIITYNDVSHKNATVQLILPNTAEDIENLCVSVSGFNTSASEYHILDLDKLTVSYQAQVSSVTEEFNGLEPSKQYFVPIDGSKGSFKVLETGQEGQYKNYFFGEVVNSIYSFNTSESTNVDSVFNVVYDNDIKPVTSVSLYENELAKLTDYMNSDMLVITSSAFKNEFSDFIDHKYNMGLDVKVVELPWVFDNFGYGEPSPYFIRDFFRYLSKNSESKVKYIMFAMDGTYDYKEVSGNSNANSSPVYLQSSNYSDFASDIWFIKDSSSTGGKLDLSIGRVPVRTQVDLQSYLEKVIAFETNDSEEQNVGIKSILAEDPYVNFQSISDNLRAKVNSLDYEDEYFSSTVASNSVKAKVIDAFNNKLFVNYMGHGSEYTLGNSHLDVADVSNLTNSDNLPIFLGLNCLSGSYEQVDGADNSLGEALISKDNAGAVAVLSANTLLSPREQEAFASQFYRSLNFASKYGSRESSRLGDLFMRSHAGLQNSSLSSNQTESFTLLGDPSLMMPQSLIPYRDLSSSSFNNDGGGGCGVVVNSPPNNGPMNILFILLLGLPLALRKKLLMEKI